MSHALQGRALTIGASLLLWGAALYGVSLMKIRLPGPPFALRAEPEPLNTVAKRDPEPVKKQLPPDPVTPDAEATIVAEPIAPGPRLEVDQGPTADSAAGPKIDGPRWIRKPTTDDLLGFYPAGPLERGIGGSVVLDCLIAANGRINCTALSETPSGFGFARAALRASRLFQIAPQMQDGRPTEGGRIAVTIVFNPPRD